MLRSIKLADERRKKRPSGPPRTIQGAAEAFIWHVKEMEAGLKRALDKKKFDVRYVGDLDNLVPVVERAFDDANLAMDALVNHQILASDFVYLSRAEFEKKEGVTLVTLGAMNQDTFDDMKPLFDKPKIYIELFMRFAGRIIGSDSRTSYDSGSGSESDSDSDDESNFGSADPPLHQRIYEKLESAANALGKCLSHSQVVNAYLGRSDDEYKDLDSATRLARFVRSCYYNRFRERLVAFLERQSRCDAIQIQITHMDGTQEEKEYRLNTIEANKTKMLESIEEHLRAIKRNLRAMDIKSRIHELVRIADGWGGWGKMSTKDDKASALESYTGRVNGLCKTFVEFTENEVTRFIGELIDTERRGVIETQIIDLISHLEQYTKSRGSELMHKARDVTEKVEAAIESAKREEEEMAREAAHNDTDGGSDEPSGLDVIMRHYSRTVIPELNRLSEQAQNTKAPKRRRLISSRTGHAFVRDTERAVVDMRSGNKWGAIKIRVEEMKESGSDPLTNLGNFVGIVERDVHRFMDELIELIKSYHGTLTHDRYKNLKEPIDDMVSYLPQAYIKLKQKVDKSHDADVKRLEINFGRYMKSIDDKAKEVDRVANEALSHITPVVTIVFGRNQTNRQHGTRFGRYVHRVAKHSARVPHRAWSA